jgi:hypothetical protein
MEQITKYNKLQDKLIKVERELMPAIHKVYKNSTLPTLYEINARHTQKLTNKDFEHFNKMLNTHSMIFVGSVDGEKKFKAFKPSSAENSTCTRIRKIITTVIKSNGYTPTVPLLVMSDSKIIDVEFIAEALMKLKFCGAMNVMYYDTRYHKSLLKTIFVDIDNETG